MNFYDWLDIFIPFLRGYYAGLPISERLRPANEIIEEAIKEFKSTKTGTNFMEEIED